MWILTHCKSRQLQIFVNVHTRPSQSRLCQPWLGCVATVNTCQAEFIIELSNLATIFNTSQGVKAIIHLTRCCNLFYNAYSWLPSPSPLKSIVSSTSTAHKRKYAFCYLQKDCWFSWFTKSSWNVIEMLHISLTFRHNTVIVLYVLLTNNCGNLIVTNHLTIRHNAVLVMCRMFALIEL